MALSPRFRFATLLRVRKHEEEQKAITLSRTERSVHERKGQRNQIEAEHQRALFAAGELAKSAFDASDLRRYHQYERYLSRLGDQKDAEIRSLQDQARTERERLLEALKKRRMLERLRERHLLAYMQQRRIAEQKMQDETAVMRHIPGPFTLHDPEKTEEEGSK
ncbi:MAG: flagellar FliJ family protein [Candidatus Hydrogenedentes bacterium]|nr:flagellar FliJ family protein [Candidatus Hydrogenedentota bacterium]